MLFEAHFKQAPFATHLNAKVMAQLIQKFPVHFPRGMRFKFNQDLNDIVQELMCKEPAQRLGIHSHEEEILQHAYFD